MSLLVAPIVKVRRIFLYSKAVYACSQSIWRDHWDLESLSSEQSNFIIFDMSLFSNGPTRIIRTQVSSEQKGISVVCSIGLVLSVLMASSMSYINRSPAFFGDSLTRLFPAEVIPFWITLSVKGCARCWLLTDRCESVTNHNCELVAVSIDRNESDRADKELLYISSCKKCEERQNGRPECYRTGNWRHRIKIPCPLRSGGQIFILSDPLQKRV